MDKLTDSEIVKALECCKQEIDDNGVICGECKKCPNYDGKTGLCKEDLPTFTLDLINRLQARVEYYKKNRNKYQDDVMYLSKQLDNLQAENERLKKGWRADVILTANAKAEAYKEFAERLKKTFPKDDFLRSTKRIAEDIDNLLKELVGEDK